MLIMSAVYADQSIEIIGGKLNNQKPTISIYTNGNTGNHLIDSNIINTIERDLSTMGEFEIKRNFGDIDSSDISDYIVTINLQPAAVKYKIISRMNLDRILGYNSMALESKNITAHKIANAIYQYITHIPGCFLDKIAYVALYNDKYHLVISDYDGYNPKIILTSNAAIHSISWSQNKQQISYVSFESGKPVIYIQDIYHAKRYVVSNFKGCNSSGRFIKNDKLLVTLTKDSGSHIYVIDNKPNAQNADLIISYGSIDTEADIDSNNNIVFTSNHDSGAQIFMTNLYKRTTNRLTIDLGKYNTSGRLSHDGTKMAFIHRSNGMLQTYLMNLTDKTSNKISNTSMDIAPSFCSNDRLILFSSEGRIYLTNLTGSKQTAIETINATDIIDQQFF